MTTARIKADSAERFLDQLKTVSFIRSASVTPARKGEERSDGTMVLRTDQGTFRLAIVVKRSYLDRASAHAITALGAICRRAGRPLLLLARYIPRPTGVRPNGIRKLDILSGGYHSRRAALVSSHIYGVIAARFERPNGA